MTNRSFFCFLPRAALAATLLVGLSACDGASSEETCADCCNFRGCGDPPPSPPDAACVDLAPPDPAAITVVAGTKSGADFAELAPDEHLSIQYGSQGGQHVWLTLHVFTGGGGTFEYRVKVDGGAGLQAAFEGCASPQWAELVDVPVFLDSNEPGSHTFQVSITPSGQPEAAMIEMPVVLE